MSGGSTIGMPREAVTIRFPKEVLDDARRARPQDQSFNEFVVEVVAREARLLRGREALKRIDALREQIFRRTGLRQKVARRLLSAEDVDMLWGEFSELPIEYLGGPELQRRTWEVAKRYALPTLYDAAFLACAELTGAPELWTADRALIGHLGAARPAYVRELGA